MALNEIRCRSITGELVRPIMVPVARAYYQPIGALIIGGVACIDTTIIEKIAGRACDGYVEEVTIYYFNGDQLSIYPKTHQEHFILMQMLLRYGDN